MDILSAYSNAEDLQEDAAQRSVVEALAELQQRLTAADSGQWLTRLLRRDRPPVRGIYLWGDVGRGKTFLMDLFFSTLALKEKRRVHFHRMMSEVHRRLKQLDDIENPLDEVAKALSEDMRVLCFDEFFVKDIGDAMILAQLLEGLFRRGVTLVATSNIPPEELYHDGLQRARFLPAIELIQEHTDVVELGDGLDYRLRTLTKAGTYLLTTEPKVEKTLTEFFGRVAPGDVEVGQTLSVLGRPIQTVRLAKGVVWFEFDELCRGPRSQEDYIEIARCYQTVVVSQVPVLTRADEDAARRFIALVDEFYDRRVKLVVSADAPLAELYRGSRLTFEFQRTQSRLVEMQSTEYLHAPHLA